MARQWPNLPKCNQFSTKKISGSIQCYQVFEFLLSKIYNLFVHIEIAIFSVFETYDRVIHMIPFYFHPDSEDMYPMCSKLIFSKLWNQVKISKKKNRVFNSGTTHKMEIKYNALSTIALTVSMFPANRKKETLLYVWLFFLCMLDYVVYLIFWYASKIKCVLKKFLFKLKFLYFRFLKTCK